MWKVDLTDQNKLRHQVLMASAAFSGLASPSPVYFHSHAWQISTHHSCILHPILYLSCRKPLSLQSWPLKHVEFDHVCRGSY